MQRNSRPSRPAIVECDEYAGALQRAPSDAMNPSLAPADAALLASIRAAQKSLTAGVYLLTTTAGDGSCHGMLVTNLATVGTQCPAIVICVNAQASVHAPLEQSGRFGVNVLGESHQDLTGVFTRKPSGEARFQHGTWAADTNGVPVLQDALASFSCRVVQALPFDGNSLFIGAIESVWCGERATPLVYADGGFRGLAAAG